MSVSIQELAKRSDIKFGTSGLRGLVENLTDEVCFAYTKAFLLSQEGDYKKVAIGHDLRPSSPQITQACISAIESQGFEAIYLGPLPTPALAYYCLRKKIPGIVVTGSHIPFDRNGIKFYRVDGEITKADESNIMQSEIDLPNVCLTFDLPSMQLDAIETYINRYVSFFGGDFLKGKVIAVYQHSSVARDLLNELFQSLGAKTILLARSDTFVPIDTEAIRAEDMTQAKTWAEKYNFDILVSTDGDADRPLVADEKGEFFRGDILGLLTAQFLNVDQVVTPVSSNTLIEKCGLFKNVVRTKIGSPYVIEGMTRTAEADPISSVVGFEANGGFLIETEIVKAGKRLSPLSTRDAVLPMLAVLGLSMAQKIPLSVLTSNLPKRFTFSDRLKEFPFAKSAQLLCELKGDYSLIKSFVSIDLGECEATDITDGLRFTFSHGDIIHLRPSGNAPELRCYAESNSELSARSLVQDCLSGISATY